MLAAASIALPLWAGPSPTASARAPSGVADGPPPHVASPPAGHTGGFGEPTCRACHSDSELNAPGSTLEVLGLEEPVRPGERRTVTVRLESFDMTAAGFQGAFRFRDGARSGETAGRVAPTDDRTRAAKDSAGRIEYIQHTAAGTPASGDLAGWTFAWIAPASGGEVVFHIAANSGNGDNSPLGDLIYAAEVRVGGDR